MQDFYGMRLASRRYGEGTLKEWDGKTVTVKFAEKSVRYWFPKVFECGELTATNEQDALRIRAAIDGWWTSLIERLTGPLSARVLSQQELSYMVKRIDKILRGCYPAEEIEKRLLAYRETLLASQKEPEKEVAETPPTPFRAFLRKHAVLFALLPLIGMGALGLICILAPLGAVAQVFGIGLGTGYDYLKVVSDVFEAGFQLPVIFSIIYAGFLVLGALSVFVFPRNFGTIGYDIFGLVFSVAAFATGVGQAAWFSATGISAEALTIYPDPGAFSIVLIVFGIVFAAFYATLTAFRVIFRKELAVDTVVDRKYGKHAADSKYDEYEIFMLLP